jgi:2'-5' RNA ligase
MDLWENWQKPYQYGTKVILPPKEIRELVNSQRQEYDPVSQSYCETHITVTEPFVRSLSDYEWDQILDLVKEFESFIILYGPLKSFLPYPCIWYQIEPREKVLKIRNTLHKTGFFNKEPKHSKDFIPHMTITEGLSGPKVNEALLERLRKESEKRESVTLK